MKKLFASLTIVAALIFGMSMNAVAQEAEAAQVAQQRRGNRSRCSRRSCSRRKKR